jgi:hypothetical protein
LSVISCQLSEKKPFIADNWYFITMPAWREHANLMATTQGTDDDANSQEEACRQEQETSHQEQTALAGGAPERADQAHRRFLQAAPQH